MPSASVASRTWKPFRRRTARTPSAADAVHRGAVRQPGVEEGLGLGDPDLANAAPQPGRPVERADHDRQDEHDERRAEPRRAEDREDRQALEDVDEAGTEERVVSRVDLVHRGGVVGRGAEREVGQLLDRHPDDGHQHQEDDLGDGEIDRREEPPQSLPDAGEDVGAGRSGGGRGDDGRGRDGRLLDGHDRRQGRPQAHGRGAGLRPHAGARPRARQRGPRRTPPGRGRSRPGCYTGAAPRLAGSIGAAVTRSLPPRFDAYIAPSALIISWSAVSPSSG